MRAIPLGLLLVATAAHAHPRGDMCKAAQNDETRKLQKLIDDGENVDDPSCGEEVCDDPAPVWCAVRGGSLAALKLLAKNGAKLDVKDISSMAEWDLLLDAAHGGRTEIVDWLIAKGRFPLDHKSAQGLTPLHLACEGGELAVVNKLIARGVKVDVKRPDGTTALMIAARKVSVPIVDALLAAGADATLANQDGATALAFAERLWWESKRSADLPMLIQHLAAKAKDFELADKDGETALMRAARRDDKEMATRWLDLGAKIDAKSKAGDTALHRAVEKPAMIDFLLSRKASPAVQNADGMTPLHAAARAGNLDAVNRLLAAKPPLDLKDKWGRTPLLVVFSESDRIKNAALRDRLLSAGGNLDAGDQKGRTALHFAVLHGDPKLVTLLLDRKVNPNVADQDGNTPLMFADEKAVAEVLIARGARLDATNKQGWPVLLMSGRRGEALMRLYLDKGADPRVVTRDGWTALMVAAGGGGAEMVKRLLAKGPPIDARTKPEGWTALHFAAYHRDAAVVALLLAARADPKVAATRDETPLHAVFAEGEVPATYYYERQRPDPVPVATKLLDAGAPIDAQDDHGRTVLMYAAAHRQVGEVRFLLARGARPTVSDDGGMRALDIARKSGAAELVTLLEPLTPSYVTAPRWHYLSEREITPAELAALSVEELVLARNEIFAFHGYTFKRPELAAYFAKQHWYKPNPAYDEKSLSEVERRNIRLLLAAEKARK